MSVFDKVKKGVNAAGEKSSALFETGKVQAEIAALKHKKKGKIQELGESVFQMLKDGALDEHKLKSIFHEAIAFEEEILMKEKNDEEK